MFIALVVHTALQSN